MDFFWGGGGAIKRPLWGSRTHPRESEKILFGGFKVVGSWVPNKSFVFYAIIGNLLRKSVSFSIVNIINRFTREKNEI